jgi:hypothetical protein
LIFFISPSLTLLPFYAKFLFKIAKSFICFAKSAKIWHKNTKLHNIQVALWDGPAKLRKEGKAKEGGLPGQRYQTITNVFRKMPKL